MGIDQLVGVDAVVALGVGAHLRLALGAERDRVPHDPRLDHPAAGPGPGEPPAPARRRSRPRPRPQRSPRSPAPPSSLPVVGLRSVLALVVLVAHARRPAARRPGRAASSDSAIRATSSSVPRCRPPRPRSLPSRTGHARARAPPAAPRLRARETASTSASPVACLVVGVRSRRRVSGRVTGIGCATGPRGSCQQRDLALRLRPRRRPGRVRVHDPADLVERRGTGPGASACRWTAAGRPRRRCRRGRPRPCRRRSARRRRRRSA